MNLIQVLLFFGGIVTYRLFFDHKGKIWIVLIASIFGVFWLQPPLLIRNLDFWFPLLSISLVIITWFLITPKENILTKGNGFTVLIIVAIPLIITLTRFLPFEVHIISTLPPQPLSFLMAFFILFFLLCVFYFIKNKNNSFAAFLIMLLLFCIFVIIKTPVLNSNVSLFLRMINGQSINSSQIQGSDLRWIGFSYIAFRLIHVICDFQNKRYQPTNLCIFFNYVLFFPALIAGPIDRIEHFESEINNKSEKSKDFIVGGKRLMVGLIKKFVIADSLVLISLNPSNALLVKSSVWLWVMLLAYTWMIYYDFSGYTDIALGLSACIGIVLPENFDHPYSAQNLTIFWNKWHMTLTQWFRSYFFNPVTRFLRSRKKPISPTIIIALTQISTMTLIGLWHGISMNYIIWGLWHGIGIFIHNRWAFYMQRYKKIDGVDDYIQKILSKISVAITFLFVSLGWIWFVIPDPQTAQSILKMLFGLG